MVGLDLGEVKPIDAEAVDLGRRLDAGDAGLAPARDLHDRVLVPIAGALARVADVRLSPDGVLNLVAFAALVDRAASTPCVGTASTS